MYRQLHKLSYAYNSESVSHNIPKSATIVVYQSVNDAVAMVVHHSPAVYLAKCVIAEAFRIVPVNPGD